jgi:hypothetical protein
MQSRLKGRLSEPRIGKKVIGGALNQAKYMFLAFIALWASARFSDYSMQFLALGLILGLKWVLGSQKQITQIFMQDERG